MLPSCGSDERTCLIDKLASMITAFHLFDLGLFILLIMEYKEFLENKIIIAEKFGFEPLANKEILLPHQNVIVNWCIEGGRRAIFASFGLGKTVMQLSIARQCIMKENKPFLIAMPLGVVGEFKKDNELLNSGYEIEYITDTDSIENYEPKIYLTNYERVRKGDIDASKFCGVCFDEASVLRNMKTETTQYVLEYFGKIPYRFVATATPTPNDFIEILNYAVFLGEYKLSVPTLFELF